MSEEIGPITKPMPLQEGRVISFCALLYAEHRIADVTRRQVRSLDSDEQDITALRQQLA